VGETRTGTNVWTDVQWFEENSVAILHAEGRIIYHESSTFLSGKKVPLLWDRTIQKQSNISMSTLQWMDIFKNSSASR
jgi:hypothetical protein